MTRLTADFWVHAYLARLRLADIPAFVTSHGDDTSGAVLVKLNTLDGRAQAFHRTFDLMTGARKWDLLAEGAERDVDGSIAADTAALFGPPGRLALSVLRRGAAAPVKGYPS